MDKVWDKSLDQVWVRIMVKCNVILGSYRGTRAVKLNTNV